jgi:hypothetical protein
MSVSAMGGVIDYKTSQDMMGYVGPPKSRLPCTQQPHQHKVWATLDDAVEAEVQAGQGILPTN